MILVSIDTSTKYASIGITNLEQSYFYNWQSQYNHGVELTRNLRTLLSKIQADASDITHLAVALGPGGFSSVSEAVIAAKRELLDLFLQELNREDGDKSTIHDFDFPYPSRRPKK